MEQTITVHGQTLHYTATVGTIRLTDEKGKPTGDVMYTAYTLDHEKGAPDRPVLFAVNGGPGASSVYLNLGAIGPKHISFANAGDSASDPATLTDNPGTWLDFTDEVFIDPIGTGFSKSLVDEAETKKLFYSPTPDIQYLSLVIYKWLVKNDRMLDKKYLIGESYGGYRGPRMTHYMQSQLGVAMNGLVLVSPYLNPSFGDGHIFADSVDDHAAVDYGGASGERAQAHRCGDAGGDCVHRGRVCDGADQGTGRQGGDRRDDREGDGDDGAGSGVCEVLGRAAGDGGVSARGASGEGRDRECV